MWLPWPAVDQAGAAVAARLVEDLGYAALWVGGGGSDARAVSRLRRALEATSSLVVATGIAGVWDRPPAGMAEAAAEIDRARPGGFLLGLGVSHPPLVERSGQVYDHPYARMVRCLDELDGLAEAGGRARTPRVLAALGPRMLRLARDRALGAHPYFVPVSHTERARAEFGPGPVLAPEVAVVVDPDPATARAAARGYAAIYLQLDNYTRNLRRLGYGGGSDRLIDDVVAWGDEEAVAARVRAHLAAGADHVAVQPIAGDGDGVDVLRRLAPVLAGL